MPNMKNAEREKKCKDDCCCCLLQTTLSCQVTNTNNSVVNVVASGAQILSKNCKHLYDCK